MMIIVDIYIYIATVIFTVFLLNGLFRLVFNDDQVLLIEWDRNTSFKIKNSKMVTGVHLGWLGIVFVNANLNEYANMLRKSAENIYRDRQMKLYQEEKKLKLKNIDLDEESEKIIEQIEKNKEFFKDIKELVEPYELGNDIQSTIDQLITYKNEIKLRTKKNDLSEEWIKKMVETLNEIEDNKAKVKKELSNSLYK